MCAWCLKPLATDENLGTVYQTFGEQDTSPPLPPLSLGFLFMKWLDFYKRQRGPLALSCSGFVPGNNNNKTPQSQKITKSLVICLKLDKGERKKKTDKQKLDFQNSLSDIQQRGTSQQDALRESIFTDSRLRVQEGGRLVQATVRPGPS